MENRKISAAVTTSAIKAAMAERYAAPEYALLFEVGNGTGGHLRGWADAIAMSLYPSRGLYIYGFEIKASRSDWIKELAQPDKAERIAQFCDYWFLVSPPDIVHPGELPPNWGHIHFKNEKLRIGKEATKLEPKDIGRPFLAAICRRQHELDRAVVDQAVYAAREEEWKRMRDDIARGDRIRRNEAESVRQRAARIKERTGVDLLGYVDDDEIAQAIRFAMKARLGGYHGVRYLVDQAALLSKKLVEAAEQCGLLDQKNGTEEQA